jgi:hypothetical protein
MDAPAMGAEYSILWLSHSFISFLVGMVPIAGLRKIHTVSLASLIGKI